MPRDYYEPQSYDDDLFEADQARARAVKREEAREALRKVSDHDAALAAQLKARMDERAKETNRRQVLGEYQAAGVEPLQVDGSGRPTATLSLLLSVGWKIENISGKNVLIAPAGYRPPRAEPDPEPVFGADPVFGAPRRDEDDENPAS